jgi:hypothetical protein
MIRILKFLFTGSWHEHQWEVIEKGSLKQGGRVIGYRHILQCKHCGNIKHVDSW